MALAPDSTRHGWAPGTWPDSQAAKTVAAAGFDRQPELLPQPVPGGDDLLVADQREADRVGPVGGQRQPADPAGAEGGRGHRVRADVDRLARLDRGVQGRAALRLDADDHRRPAERGEPAADAGQQPAAADRDGDHVALGQVGRDLGRQRALTRDHRRVVVGVHVQAALVGREGAGGALGVGVHPARLDHLGAGRGDPRRLDVRHRDRDVDGRGDAQPARGGGDAEPVVAAGRGHDGRVPPAALALALGQQRVERAADLEHARRLQVLKLEADLAAVGAHGQQRGSAHVGGDPPGGGGVILGCDSGLGRVLGTAFSGTRFSGMPPAWHKPARVRCRRPRPDGGDGGSTCRPPISPRRRRRRPP